MRIVSLVGSAGLALAAACAGTVGDGGGSAATDAAPDQPLQGAWHLVEVWGSDSASGEWRTTSVQPSVYLFLNGYYSIAAVGGNEKRPQMKEDATRAGLTAEEAASVWIPYTSNSGRYEMAGDQLTIRPMVALWPNFMEGGSATYTFTMEGERLHLWTSGEGTSWHARLERLP
jgi:hypothetical protein